VRLHRISRNPIFQADPRHPWEAAAVFNAAAVYEKGLFHMIYRATDIGGHERFGEYHNALGYAVSKDLRNWHRLAEPVLKPEVPQELRGPEDPRIVKLGDLYYMTYTGFGGRFPGDYRICLAVSPDLIHWERRGVLLDEPNKNSAFFPRRFGNRYFLLHRRGVSIWLAETEDFEHFKHHTPILDPRPGTWEASKVGIAGPPVHHPQGWLLIYHAVDENNVYRLGAALLDANAPHRVLARHPQPLLEPKYEWERRGYVDNVVFSCATLEVGAHYVVIYAGADTAIGAAYIRREEVWFPVG